jgi:O-antigen/teichoic acid export membrane protein
MMQADAPSLLLIGRLGATALAFVTAPIVARTIGPDGRGETAAAIALFNIVPILLGIGIPLEVRRLSALGKSSAAIRTARLLFVAAVPIAVAIGVLGWFTIFATFKPEARLVAAVGIAMCPLMMMWTCDSSVLVAKGRYRGVMALQLVQPSAYLALVLIFALGGWLTTATVLVANIAGTLAACVTGITLTRISTRGERYPAFTLLRGGVRYAGSSIAETASSRLDQVIALPLMGAFQAGIYSVAVTIATIPLALGQALGAAYFPLIARASGESRRVHKESAIRASFAMSAIAAPLLFLGSWLGIPLLFGDGFAAAVPVAWICGIGTCALIAGYVCSLALAAEGRGYAMTFAQVGALVLSITLLFLLAPEYGAIGAAAASSMGYVVLLGLLLAAARTRPRYSWPRLRDFRLAIRTLFRPRSDAP